MNYLRTKNVLRLLAALTLLALLALAPLAQPAQAEGTRELADFELAQGGNARVGLTMQAGRTEWGIMPFWVVFNVYLQAGETLHLGSNSVHTGQGNIYVWAPGTPVYSSVYPDATLLASAIVNCVAQSGGDTTYGLINTRAKEVAGPLPNPGGYNSCQYTATTSGIYPVLFAPSGASQGGTWEQAINPATIIPVSGFVHAWDATVRDASGVEQTGRLFSNTLVFVEWTNPDQQFYVLTRDGHQYRVQFDELNGAGWAFLVNNKGVQSAATGQPTYKSWRTSQIGAAQVVYAPYAPDTASDVTYKLFVNPPDPVVVSGPGGLAETLGYLTSPLIPPSPTNLQFDGTNAGGGPGWAANPPPWSPACQFTFDSDPALDQAAYSLIVDANDNGSFDDAADRLLRGVFDSAGNSVDFDGRDGSGVPLTGDRTYAVKLFALAGEIHYPMFDIESLGGLHIERLTTLGAGNIHQAHYDDLNGIALTNASPTSLAGGGDSSPHGSGFRGFTGTSGDEDVADSWTFTDAGTFATTSINFSIGTAANLAIDKSANPTNPSPGGTIEYVLTFSNAGTATATGIVVSDVVPISVTVTGTNCSADSSCVETTVTPPTYTWSVGDLAPGEGGVITITGQVLGSLGDKDGFFNTATIHGDSNDDSAWVEVEVFDPTAVTLASFEATQGDSAVAAANGLQAVAWGAVALLGLLAGAIFRRRR